MGMESQAILLEIREQPAVERGAESAAKAKLRTVNRDQSMLAQIWVDELIGPDHKTRAIWELTGRMDLSRFAEPLRTTQGCAGRPAWAPGLLVSLWIYAYSEGISSAREIERLMEWEPELQWLAGYR